jgi:hypothetical protein
MGWWWCVSAVLAESRRMLTVPVAVLRPELRRVTGTEKELKIESAYRMV